MSAKHYFSINQRKLSQFDPLPNDLELNPDKNYLFDLSHLAVLSAEGDKAADFLQGQYSCDVSKVSNDQMRQGLRCNLKGRIMGMADIFMHQGIKLLMPADLCESTLNALQKTAVFSKVTISEQKNWAIYGFYQQNNDSLTPFSMSISEEKYACQQLPHGCIYSLGEGLYIIIIEKDAPLPSLAEFQSSGQWKSALAWHRLCLSRGRVEIYEDTRALFLPHRLDLQLTGYISFDKGCYKGQEIIARTHYKAKLKHHLQIFSIETRAKLQSGQRLFDKDHQQEVAELIDYCPLDEQRWLVALSILKDYQPSVLAFETEELMQIL